MHVCGTVFWCWSCALLTRVDAPGNAPSHRSNSHGLFIPPFPHHCAQMMSLEDLEAQLRAAPKPPQQQQQTGAPLPATSSSAGPAASTAETSPREQAPGLLQQLLHASSARSAEAAQIFLGNCRQVWAAVPVGRARHAWVLCVCVCVLRQLLSTRLEPAYTPNLKPAKLNAQMLAAVLGIRRGNRRGWGTFRKCFASTPCNKKVSIS